MGHQVPTLDDPMGKRRVSGEALATGNMHTSALRLLRYPTGGSAYGRCTASAACEEVIGRYALERTCAMYAGDGHQAAR